MLIGLVLAVGVWHAHVLGCVVRMIGHRRYMGLDKYKDLIENIHACMELLSLEYINMSGNTHSSESGRLLATVRDGTAEDAKPGGQTPWKVAILHPLDMKVRCVRHFNPSPFAQLP